MPTVQVSITSSANDGHSQPDGTGFATSPPSGLIRVGRPLSVSFGGWWRFTGVTIPQGATINSATLTLTAGDTRVGQTVIGEISAEDADAPAAPTSGGYGSRTKTTATAAWSFPANLDDLDEAVSPDISPIIQELVSRGGWGEVVVLYVDNDGSTDEEDHAFYDYLNDPAYVAVLDVDYTEADTEVCVLVERTETLIPDGQTALIGDWTITGAGTTYQAVAQLFGDVTNNSETPQDQVLGLSFSEPIHGGTVTAITLHVVGASADPTPETRTLQALPNFDGATAWEPDFDDPEAEGKSNQWTGLSLDASALNLTVTFSAAKGETLYQVYAVATVEETVCSEPSIGDWMEKGDSDEACSLLDDDREEMIGV